MFVATFPLNSRYVSPTHIHWRVGCHWWLDWEWTPDLWSWVCNTPASPLNSGPSYVVCQWSDVIKRMRWMSLPCPLFQDDPRETQSAAWWRGLVMKTRQFTLHLSTTVNHFWSFILIGWNITQALIYSSHFNHSECYVTSKPPWLPLILTHNYIYLSSSCQTKHKTDKMTHEIVDQLPFIPMNRCGNFSKYIYKIENVSNWTELFMH